MLQDCDVIPPGSYRDARNTDRNSLKPLARSNPSPVQENVAHVYCQCYSEDFMLS